MRTFCSSRASVAVREPIKDEAVKQGKTHHAPPGALSANSRCFTNSEYLFKIRKDSIARVITVDTFGHSELVPNLVHQEAVNRQNEVFFNANPYTNVKA